MTEIVGEASTPIEPGWYSDPWQQASWRWWDGTAWTGHVGSASDKQPSLPLWLSVPVLIGIAGTCLLFISSLVYSPRDTLIGMALGLVPLFFIFPMLAWLDRVEPEPPASRIHAMLWGATVAGFCSAVVNGIVASVANEAWMGVVSAPFIEEITKGLGIAWALKRREVDGLMDGIVYAGWIALGFAAVENMTYFTQASATNQLATVFILRTTLTPFAHPLFTAWTGLAIGLAVHRRQSVLANGLWGLGLAICCHAAWNGTLTYAGSTGNSTAPMIVAICFLLLFLGAVVTVILIRRAEKRAFTAIIPVLAHRHGLTAEEVAIFGDWKRLLATRKLTPRAQRADFDKVHAALGRLSLFYHREGTENPVGESLLAAQLRQARQAQPVLGR